MAGSCRKTGQRRPPLLKIRVAQFPHLAFPIQAALLSQLIQDQRTTPALPPRTIARKGVSSLIEPAAMVLTLILALGIAYGTLSPAPEIPSLPGNDKANHFQAFLLLTLPTAILAPRRMVWTVPMIVAFGAAIELIQPFVGRDREFGDFAIDCLGCIMGIVIGWIIRRLASFL